MAVLQVCLAGGQVGAGLFQLCCQRAAVLLARHQLVAHFRCGGCSRRRQMKGRYELGGTLVREAAVDGGSLGVGCRPRRAPALCRFWTSVADVLQFP